MNRIKFKNSKYLLLLMILSISCSNKIERKVIGTWSIDLDSSKVCHREWDIVDNLLVFRENSSCSLPKIYKQNLNDCVGQWTLINDSVILIAPTNPLHGKYKIIFYKENNLKFKMKLTNDSTVLICSKFLMDFENNASNLLKVQ